MKLLLPVLITCFMSCESNQPEKELKEIYLLEFKTTYFKSLLRKGFNNNSGYIEAVSIDNSHYAESILSIEDNKFIDSLTTAGNQIMVNDSIQSYGHRAEGSEGKRVFYYAIERYNSKWLDSISMDRFKTYWKGEIDFRKSLK